MGSKECVRHVHVDLMWFEVDAPPLAPLASVLKDVVRRRSDPSSAASRCTQEHDLRDWRWTITPKILQSCVSKHTVVQRTMKYHAHMQCRAFLCRRGRAMCPYVRCVPSFSIAEMVEMACAGSKGDVRKKGQVSIERNHKRTQISCAHLGSKKPQHRLVRGESRSLTTSTCIGSPKKFAADRAKRSTVHTSIATAHRRPKRHSLCPRPS